MALTELQSVAHSELFYYLRGTNAVSKTAVVTADEFGAEHRAFADGLEFEDFERVVAGGDEEAAGRIEDGVGDSGTY